VLGLGCWVLGSGMSIEEILEDHPELEREDILASLQYVKMYLFAKTITLY